MPIFLFFVGQTTLQLIVYEKIEIAQLQATNKTARKLKLGLKKSTNNV